MRTRLWSRLCPGMREIPFHYVLSLFCSPRRTGRTSASCAAATAYLPPPATSGFAAGSRKGRPAFRTAPARPVTHPTAHLTTSLTCCVWRMSFISTGGPARLSAGLKTAARHAGLQHRPQPDGPPRPVAGRSAGSPGHRPV